jgi:Cft2 family RNA processing exonuclease
LFRWSENEYEDDITFDQKEWRYIYFTGDIGTVRGNINSNILFKEHQIPFSNPNKIVIMESTYGGIIREKKDNIYEERIAKLADIIFTNFQNGGFILIPVFALDRAQQLLVDLYYIISKYTINGKKWHEPEVLNFNWNKILLNKDKITLLKLLII